MDVEEFSQRQRRFVRRSMQGQLTFVPPPAPRAVEFDAALVAALSAADRALGELSGVGKRIRNSAMLVRPYLHREAVLSSRIEGTQSSLSDLLLFEADAPTDRPDDAREVLNYVRALEWGVAQLPKLPLSLRLIRGLHGRLLEGVRGADTTPGEFRRSQNWIGAKGTPIERAMFVPPPPEELDRVLDEWEKYVHEEDGLPPLVKCALIHFQFETIHPFTDGNGRVGRLLMPLFLIERQCLSKPLLYLSAFFEKNRSSYYDSLSQGRLNGDLRPWLNLFLQAVATQARDAAARADLLTAYQEEVREKLSSSRSAVVHRLIDALFTNLFVVATREAARQKVTYAAAQAGIDTLVRHGVLREMTGRSYGKVYSSRRLLDIVDRPTAPTPKN
jgi:Fic family protein